MIAQELSEYIKGIPPDMEIKIQDPGCGCCAINDTGVDFEFNLVHIQDCFNDDTLEGPCALQLVLQKPLWR